MNYIFFLRLLNIIDLRDPSSVSDKFVNLKCENKFVLVHKCN